jgi:hemoglobin-like flavoprotein
MLVVSPLVSTLRHLDLSRNALGPGGAASLAVSKYFSRLRTLALAQNNLGRQGLQLLLTSSGLNAVEELDISSNSLGPNGAMALASSSMARRLKSLDVSDNEIEDAGLAGLLGTPQLAGLSQLAVAQNSLTPSGIGLFDGVAMQVEGLDISHNELGERGGALLAGAMARIRVRKLRLQGTGLSGSELASIVQNGAGCLTALDASENDMDSVGMDQLSRSPELRSVQHLVLNRTCNGPQGIISLMSSPYLMNLQSLEFNANNVGDRGVVEMASSSGLISLEELSLQDNGISFQGAVALSTSPLAGRLKCLDLSYNRLGDTGAEALAHGPNWQQLRKLRLVTNDVGLSGAASLSASPSMEMLQVLDLRDNPLLGELDVQSLARDKVALMESTFAKISSDGQRFAERFYEKLFERYPGVKPLFSNVSMSRQKQHLFSALVMVIDNLQKPQELEESLTRLGQRHVDYGVSPSHYYAVSGTLLDVIRFFLKDDWNDDVQEAWSDGLEAVSRVMMNAHRQQR